NLTPNQMQSSATAYFMANFTNHPEAQGVSVTATSLIGRSRSSAFRLSTTTVSMSPHGLVLLYGIGTKALPSWDSKTRWSDLMGGLTVRLTVGPSGCANSPHPSSREGHHSTGLGGARVSSYRV